jgi:hypothetical protein
MPTWLVRPILDLFGAVLRIRIQSDKPDPDRIRENLVPHWREKPDPDLHGESEKPDSDPHQSQKPDSDPHQSKGGVLRIKNKFTTSIKALN